MMSSCPLLPWPIRTLDHRLVEPLRLRLLTACEVCDQRVLTNARFLSFFLFHAPSFILLLYCAFEFKSHVTKSTSFPYEPYATREMLRPLWFPLVLVHLSTWLSHSPADPALILPPISFNKLTQAQTWDNSSYSVPSEGDTDNGRCFVSSSMLLWMSQWLYCTLLSV